MASKEDKTALAEASVIELRRLYDSISESFEHVRSKALGLLAGEIAIITFLFSSGTEKFFILPVPIYGFVLFGVGIALLLTAFMCFLRVVSTVSWKHPPEEKDIARLHERFDESPLKFYDYLQSEYMESINHCAKKINERSRFFMIGLYTLSGGILVMVMLKYLSILIK